MRNTVFIFISLLLLLLLPCMVCVGQELPPISNYPSNVYVAGNQNWSISQTSNKFIYIANNDGLLEYNGAKWTLYPSPNATIMRSVAAKDDLLYTGSYMDFGYWETTPFGNRSYTSLSKKLQLHIVEDEQFWNIIPYENWVLFQSLNRIYIYNTVDEEVSIISVKNTIHEIHNLDGVIYFQVANEGLYRIQNSAKTLVSDATIFKDDVVVGLFQISEGIKVITRANGIFNFVNNRLQPWSTNVNSLTKSLRVYTSIQLADGSFMLGTISNGVYHISASGELLFVIKQNTGLSDNTALSLFEDDEKNVWVGLDNGVDCVNLSAPFTNYIDQSGTLGTTYASIVYKDMLYLGTNQGLFVKKYKTEDDFKLINGTQGQVWSLNLVDTTLFCGHNSGTFIVNGNSVSLIGNAMGTWGVKKISGQPNLLLQGNYSGLHILEKKEGSWALRNKIEGFDISSRYFEMVTPTKIMVSHEYKGVYVVYVNENYSRVNKYDSDPSVSKGNKSSLVSFDDSVLYAKKNGIFKFDEAKLKFQKDTILSAIYKDDSYVSGKLMTDADQKLWAFTKNYITYVAKESLNESYKISKIPIPQSLRNDMKGFENISEISPNLYLLGTSNGYLQIDVTEIKVTDYEVLLNAVYLGADEITSQRIFSTSSGNFESNENDLSFEYSVPEYDKYLEAEFQYRLISGDGTVIAESPWSTDSATSFENLKYGSYDFTVYARVNNKNVETPAAYSFNIKRPWYVSTLAIIAYVMFTLVFFILLNWFYKRYYRRQRERAVENAGRELALNELSSQKEIVELKNDKLNQDIEARNRELAISTMSMIKRNNALNDIKAKLLQQENSNATKPIVKEIDGLLNDKEDWKFFEEAFNHADKDFFKKVKEKHPELTASDLRLCVYLRLNLSSKEIAPLLNISPRSVEIKRYRLRKKINLDREFNLNTYFIDL